MFTLEPLDSWNVAARGGRGESDAPRSAGAGEGYAGATQPRAQPDGSAGGLLGAVDSDGSRPYGAVCIESSEAAEAVQDVTSLAHADATDHFLVVLLWFVPVTLALLVTVWVTPLPRR